MWREKSEGEDGERGGSEGEDGGYTCGVYTPIFTIPIRAQPQL